MSYSSRYSSSYSTRYGDSSSHYGDSSTRFGDVSSRYSSRKDYSGRTDDYTNSVCAKESNGSDDYGKRSSKYRSYYSDYLDDSNSLSNTKKKHLEDDEETKKRFVEVETDATKRYLEDDEGRKQKCLDDDEEAKEKYGDDEGRTKREYPGDENGTKKRSLGNVERIKKRYDDDGAEKGCEEDERSNKERPEEEEGSKKQYQEQEEVPELSYNADAARTDDDDEQMRSLEQNETLEEEVGDTHAKEAKEEDVPVVDEEETEVLKVEEKELVLNEFEVKYDAKNKRSNLDAESVHSLETQQMEGMNEHEETVHGKEKEEAPAILDKSNMLSKEADERKSTLAQFVKFTHDEAKHCPETQETPVPRTGKTIIEQSLLKNKVADLIAKFNKCSADEEPSSWKHKTDLGIKPVGKIQSTFLK